MRSSESSGVLIFADPATLGVDGVGLVHFHVESLLGKASIKTNLGQVFGREAPSKVTYCVMRLLRMPVPQQSKSIRVAPDALRSLRDHLHVL